MVAAAGAAAAMVVVAEAVGVVEMMVAAAAVVVAAVVAAARVRTKCCTRLSVLAATEPRLLRVTRAVRTNPSLINSPVLTCSPPRSAATHESRACARAHTHTHVHAHARAHTHTRWGAAQPRMLPVAVKAVAAGPGTKCRRVPTVALLRLEEGGEEARRVGVCSGGMLLQMAGDRLATHP
jgi:hypothetical protein